MTLRWYPLLKRHVSLRSRISRQSRLSAMAGVRCPNAILQDVSRPANVTTAVALSAPDWEPAMTATATAAALEYVLHSPDASWCYDKWEKLPNDGNRYEVIDGV